MTRKVFLLTATILIVIVLAFFGLRSFRAPAPAPEVNVPTEESPRPVELTTDAIRSALRLADPSADLANGRGVSIVKQLDLTGDGQSEVLVNTGMGGAYTESFAILQLLKGEWVVAEFTNQTGDVHPAVSLLEGASVRNGEAFEVMPERGAFFTAHYEIGASESAVTLDACSGEAFVWNDYSDLFEYNSQLSSTTETRFCEDLRGKLNP